MLPNFSRGASTVFRSTKISNAKSFFPYAKRTPLLFTPAHSRLSSRVALMDVKGQVERVMQLDPVRKFAVFALGSSAVTLGAMGIQGALKPVHPSYAYVNKRLKATYSYLLLGLSSTAGITAMLFQRGVAAKMMSMNPWMLMFGSMALTIGSSIMVRSIPYENTIPKHLMFLTFNSCVALSLVPLGYLGGSIVMKAATATGCLVGALSLLGATAPSETYMQTRGPLSLGFGLVIGASIGQLVFPQSTLLMNVALYGGLVVFGGFVFQGTNRNLSNAKYAQRYDPINSCMGIYMSTINIFVRMAQILSMGKRK